MEITINKLLSRDGKEHVFEVEQNMVELPNGEFVTESENEALEAQALSQID